MVAFSTPPADDIDVCVKTKGTDSDKVEAETALQGHWDTHSSDTLSACNIAEKTIGTVPVRPSGDGAMASTQGSTAPIAPPIPSNDPWCLLKTGLHSDRVSNEVDSTVVAPKSWSKLPEVSEGSGAVEDTEDDTTSIGAGNWLDVTHAMLDAL
ncbi:unnamed protein product [Ectocarpus fasciculatus]